MRYHVAKDIMSSIVRITFATVSVCSRKCAKPMLAWGSNASAPETERKGDEHPRCDGIASAARRHEAPVFHRVERRRVEPVEAARGFELNFRRHALLVHEDAQNHFAFLAQTTRGGRVRRRRIVEVVRAEAGGRNRR